MGSTPMHSLECLTLCVSLNIGPECVLIKKFVISEQIQDFQNCATQQIRPHTRSDTSPLDSTIVRLLTFTGKCDAVGFRLLLGLFHMVFLWGQTSGTPGEGCRASLPASNVQKWELRGELQERYTSRCVCRTCGGVLRIWTNKPLERW